MTGPFLRVQETKHRGPTWVNVARIVKIQQSSNGTSIFLEGASTMQIEEAAEVIVDRLERAVVGRMVAPKTTRRGRLESAEERDG